MQTDGNLVLYYRQGGAWDALWATGTGGGSSNHMSLTEGDLIVSEGSSQLYRSGSSALSSELVLQDDGNLVIYGASPAGYPYAVWATGTEGNQGNALTTGETLAPGQYLQSQNGQYQLQMGASGVLVLAMQKAVPTAASPTGTYECPIWSGPAQTKTTSTSGSGYTHAPVASSYALLQPDGNFVVYPPQGTTGGALGATWTSGTSGRSVAKIIVGTDGNVVFDTKTGRAVTSLNTNQDRGNTWCTGEVLQGNVSDTSDLNPTSSSSFNPASSNGEQYITNLVGGATYKLQMESTCHLTLTNGTGKEVWTKGTSHSTVGSGSKYANCYAILLQNGQIQVVEPKDGSSGDVSWTSGKVATQPFTIQAGGVIGPFYAFTPSTSGTKTIYIANQAGNQLYPGKSKALKYALKAIKVMLKIVIKLG